MQEKEDSGPGGHGDDYAAQIRDAESAISRAKEGEVKVEAAKKPPVNWRPYVYAALILASFLTIYGNFPEFMTASFTQQPLRAGSYATDKKTDLCVQNLWAIAAALRAGAKPPALKCPASGAPYVIEKGSARCPNPALHGALKLYADKKNVIPALEK